MLVVPFGATNPRTGGGQRTRLLFDGLKRLGEVSVVYLTSTEDSSEGISEFFPGADRVLSFRAHGVGPKSKSILHRLVDGALRVICPSYLYKTDAKLSHKLLGLVNQLNPDVVAFRYTLTFAKTGYKKLETGQGRVLLDVDDRDDIKTRLQIENKFGDYVPSMLFSPAIKSLERKLDTVWANADQLLFAKEADLLNNPQSVEQSLVPNAPHQVPISSEINPASNTDPIILFVGSAGHSMNLDGVIWFLRNCWKSIHTQIPSARFRIVGLGNWSRVSAEIGFMSGVDVVGKVDSLLGEYNRARLAICPIWVGAGSQIKLIEACAHERQVVTTPVSATGFGHEIETTLAVSGDAASFSESCVSYLSDSNLAEVSGKKLRELQERLYSREHSLERIRDSVNTISRRA